MKVILALIAALSFSLAGQSQPYMNQPASLQHKIEAIQSKNYPDYLPETWQQLMDEYAELESALTQKYATPSVFMDKLQKFEARARAAEKILLKPINLYNTVSAVPFENQKMAIQFYRAEAMLHQAIGYVDDSKPDSATIFAKNAEKTFNSLLQQSKRNTMVAYADELKQEEQRIASERKLLAKSGQLSSTEVSQMSNAVARMKPRFPRPQIGLDFDGVLEPPVIWPPLPEPKGPIPSQYVALYAEDHDKIKIEWIDKSDNETGTRIYRSTRSQIGALLDPDILIVDLPAVDKDSMAFFIDSFNLEQDRQYWYWVSVYNAEGERRSSMRTIYTQDTFEIPLYRLRIKIQVADVSDAGCDCEISVGVGDLSGNYVYLDYAQDDFERGSTFIYDLSTEGLDYLHAINSIRIYNGSQDAIKLKKIEVFANWRNSIFSKEVTELSSLDNIKIFEKEWLANEGWLENSGVVFDHLTIRAHPLWNAYVQRMSVPGFIQQAAHFPIKFVPQENGSEISLFISKQEIESRIQTIIGHNIHKGVDQKPEGTVDLDDFVYFDWYRFRFQDQQGVWRWNVPFKTTVKNANTLSVFAHLEPYSLGNSDDGRFVGWLKDAISGTFKLDFDITFSLFVALDTIVENGDSLADIQITGAVRVPENSVKIDASLSLGGKILAGLLLRGGFFYGDNVLNWAIENCLLNEGISILDERINSHFTIPLEELEGFIISPGDITVQFGAFDGIEACCIIQE